MNQEATIIGEPLDRVDGRAKVTGAARYSADVTLDNMAHAVMIMSSIASGRIIRMDTHEAERAPGVIAILTPFNAPRIQNGSIAVQGSGQESIRSSGERQQPRRPPARHIHLLQEDTVFYNNQPIGVVVADTFEHARDGAGLVHVRYEETRAVLVMEKELRHAFLPPGGSSGPNDTGKGSAQEGWSTGAVRLDETYVTQVQTHNPIEPHATVAVWNDPTHLTLYDATQGVFTDRERVASLLELPPENVRIISPFVGGGFGCKGPVWSHVLLAAISARAVGRPVKLVLTRKQMFQPVGFRGVTFQRLRLAAKPEGSLTLLQHDGIAQTSMFDTFAEPVTNAAKMLYATPVIATSLKAVRLNSGTPSYTRAPGEASGSVALESAMDELAYKLMMDPIELRHRNYAETDPLEGKPWSSKSLRQCYQVGAERFGWARRAPQPGTMRDGTMLVGMGMATATYPTHRSAASARARLHADGSVEVECGTQEIGTGTYTVMTQVAADGLGLETKQVRFSLGDTTYPQAPVSGGSQTAASAGSAVLAVAQALRSKLIEMATSDHASPLFGANEAEVQVDNGRMFLTSIPTRGETYAALLARQGMNWVEERAQSQPGPEQQKYAMHAFGAQFAEVRVDPDLKTIRVARFTGAFAAGTILNEKTARSQLIGGIIWGIGLALEEETEMDPRHGRIMNADLAEYMVPVNADIPEIDIATVPERDPYVNPLGVKGIGEIGIVGAAAAIANAVYHATGKRVRDLPIRLDKLM